MVAMEKCEPKYEPRCRIFFAEGQKFRTNLLVLFFDLPLKRETATKTALLAEVLRQGEDPTGAARQAELLFGAHWDISVVKKGGRLCGGFRGNRCRGAACILSGASGNGKGEGLFLRRKG